MPKCLPIAAYVVPRKLMQMMMRGPRTRGQMMEIHGRMIKEMGFDWLDQLETAPGF